MHTPSPLEMIRHYHVSTQTISSFYPQFPHLSAFGFRGNHCLMLPINILLHASCSCMFCLNSAFGWKYDNTGGAGMNSDLGLRLQGFLEVLKGLKSEVEHVSENTYVHRRGLGSSAGLYISTHQLFFLICQLLFCLLTSSLAAAFGMRKGTCQN